MKTNALTPHGYAGRHDDYFGLCPICKETGLRVDDASGFHWFVCKIHLLRWLDGRHMTSQFEVVADMEGIMAAEALLVENVALLENCREVDPFFWPRTQGIY